jgi:hypothetical protein
MRCGPQPAAIELAHLVAGATIGRLLAEQGANVIKVQPPIVIGSLRFGWTSIGRRNAFVRDFVERPGAWLNVRGAADVPETN